MTRRRFISTCFLVLAALLFDAGRVQADNILDFVFEGQTENSGGHSINNLNGQSLKGKSFEFGFGVDKSQLSDSDSKSSKAKFQTGLTKGFFKIGGDLYEGQGDLTDYEIKIYNDEGGKDKFEIKFKNFFGDDVYKNGSSKGPDEFKIKLEDSSETAFDQDPTAENFPNIFEIGDWSKAEFEIKWSGGTKIEGEFSAFNGGAAVPEPEQYLAISLLALVGFVFVRRAKKSQLKTSR